VHKKVQRVSAREGYDLWSDTYDKTPNPVVAMDMRHTVARLAPGRGERILDAGCGTGRNIRSLLATGCHPIGIDFSHGMLKVARQNNPGVPLAQADIQRPLPLKNSWFDAVLCALVGEHLDDLPAVFRELHGALRAGGRLVFSVYHPEMAAAGIEANFEREGTEFRLGACRHTTADYMNLLADAGFSHLARHEFAGDEQLVEVLPRAAKYLGFPVLLVVEARKESRAC
jgi:SAM-dependent methyltransferase